MVGTFKTWYYDPSNERRGNKLIGANGLDIPLDWALDLIWEIDISLFTSLSVLPNDSVILDYTSK